VAIVGPQISPDGSHVAFSTFANGEPCSALTDASHTPFCFDVVSATSATKPALSAWLNFEYPAWVGSSRLLLFNDSGTLSYTDTSKSGYETWFNWLDDFKTGTDGFGEWILGRRIGGRRAPRAPYPHRQQIAVCGLDVLRYDRCANWRPDDICTFAVTVPAGRARWRQWCRPKHPDLPAFKSISLSPDGGSVAFDFKGSVYVTHLGSLSDCAQISTRRVIKAGLDPHFGAA
jgi:hypothetical protein